MGRDDGTPFDADRIAQYDRIIASVPGVARKGKSVPYTAVNGHMFSFLDPSGTLVLRLPATERGAFMAAHGATLHEAHGTVMKEYVTVPERLFADAAALAPQFITSHAYVAALKPKPTTRRGA
jgi:hypothetical protein